MLQLKNITKDYTTSSEVVHALRGISISFRKSEFVSILGPSGCGKTTLLNIIGGLDHYTDGDLVIGGRSTKFYKDRDWDVYRNHRVGFIFQSYNLIPHQTVLGNVELALTIAGVSREERIERAKRALDRVGLSDQYYKKPNQLSGGQCQRVAIARALVNDPEILLADEPTGALDTVTSVQIMDLIKEISNERLVIMVTHNPELAEEYSSRIVRLLDGNIIEDSNPMSDEEEEAEIEAEALAIAEAEAAEEAAESEISADSTEGAGKTRPNAKKKKPKQKERAKMSFLTAFRLSAKNLLSKRGRTALVAFAGSIGIIGIALVLAFSAGIKGYIASMQDDMLSGNPVKITENTLDLTSLTGLVNQQIDRIPGNKVANSVYVSSLVEYLVKTSDTLGSMMISNDLTEDYIKYVDAMPKEYYNAMIYEYGFDMLHNIYTDFKLTPGSSAEYLSLRNITDIYKSVLNGTDYKKMTNLVDTLTPTFSQAPNNADYILSQYDLLGDSKIATEVNEVMLVLNSEDELSDLLLARLGYYTQAEFLEVINKASSEDGTFNESLYREYFTYDELLSKTLWIFETDDILSTETKETTNQFTGATTTTTTAIYSGKLDDPTAKGMELKVVGILTPKDGISYGALSSGIYYTEALTNHILEANSDSEFIASYLPEGSSYKSINYSYEYYPFDAFNGAEIVGEAESASGSVIAMTASLSSLTSMTAESLVRSFGGNSLPNAVAIYPLSFDDKDLVTDYLNQWNDETLTITVDGKEIAGAERKNVKYTDTLELVISMINTMIDIVSYALIAFTSVSLVVSTVMIGIITYVSVVERIKEIGVIRSLGGRKKDVSYLFNAETFIIGSAAGLMGVGATYLISIIVNAILKPLIGYANIAALPVSNALLLLGLSIALTLISGLIPASSAAKKDPVVALRTE